MTTVIKSGTGNGGYEAEVNVANQLEVKAESVPSEGFQAKESGKSFILHGECHTAAGASGGFMSFTNLESDSIITVTRIYIDPHTITPTDLIVTQVFNATISNGTDISSTGIVQKNQDSSETLSGTLTISDSSSDVTYTGGTQYHAFPVKTMTAQQRNMNETNVLGNGDSITWGWKTVGGGNATDGEVVSFSVNLVKRSIV